jgi:hypothetical protein
VLALVGGAVAMFWKEGKPLDGPRPVGSLDQRDWERHWQERLAAVAKAQDTGNDLVIGDREKELRQFFISTFREGETLSGWVGVVTSVGTDEYTKGPDGKKPLPSLTGEMALRDLDANDASVSITFTNYDPGRKALVGLDKEFRALRTGELARVWGKLHKPNAEQMGPVSATVTVTRLEPVDLKRRRAEAFALLEKAAAALPGLKPDLEKQAKASVSVGGAREWGEYTDAMIQSRSLAAAFPEYREAVKRYNAFRPPPPGRLEEWAKAIPAAQSRLKAVRFLNEDEEKASARQVEADVSRASAAAKQQLKHAATVSEYWSQYRSLLRQKRVKELLKLEEFPPEVRAELENERSIYVPLTTAVREEWQKKGYTGPWTN